MSTTRTRAVHLPWQAQSGLANPVPKFSYFDKLCGVPCFEDFRSSMERTASSSTICTNPCATYRGSPVACMCGKLSSVCRLREPLRDTLTLIVATAVAVASAQRKRCIFSIARILLLCLGALVASIDRRVLHDRRNRHRSCAQSLRFVV